jgi:hypothetical protein
MFLPRFAAHWAGEGMAPTSRGMSTPPSGLTKKVSFRTGGALGATTAPRVALVGLALTPGFVVVALAGVHFVNGATVEAAPASATGQVGNFLVGCLVAAELTTTTNPRTAATTPAPSVSREPGERGRDRLPSGATEPTIAPTLPGVAICHDRTLAARGFRVGSRPLGHCSQAKSLCMQEICCALKYRRWMVEVYVPKTRNDHYP